MLRVKTIFLIAAALVACASSSQDTAQENEPTDPDVVVDPSHGGCGTERWSLKVGTDTAATSIAVSTPQTTTIAALRALAAPASLPTSARIAPTETTAFRLVNVTLNIIKSESDSDYHLVLADAAGNTMIAEVPSPACVTGSPWSALVAKARAVADANKGMRPLTVTLQGVGFFDFIHGQTGVASNGIEIHPVLGLCVGKDCVIAP